MKTYSTVRVAKIVGVGWSTLHRWIVEGKVEAPPVQSLDGFRVRHWTEEETAKVRQYKAEHYWGKGGRKKRKKRAN
jgi:predicted site-specific integrase-resolvase